MSYCPKCGAAHLSTGVCRCDEHELMNDIITTMRHARVFIVSRHKMHPTGVQLYDELLEKLEHNALADRGAS